MMTHALQFLEQGWERIGDGWITWRAGELDRLLMVIENPVFTRMPEEFSREFLLEKPVEYMLIYTQSRVEAKQVFSDVWPEWCPFFGAEVDATFLGSGLHCSKCVN